ncbi:reverse transcriptase [Trichoderma cornu-damae]|uniref:Reverse transcriptase n=1 Tax=Trichoderma cornu-damae TaxID=654480 RepID=A0A9P8QL45_9HYPO|nr:reverse transcriptase [Trichoderma cornu-damae]
MSAMESSDPAQPRPAIWRSTADDDSTLLDDLDHEPKVLKWYRDWDEWRRDIQPHVDVFIWRYMWSDNPSDELRSCPIPPQVQQFNPHARDVSELTKDEFDRYHDQNKIYYSKKQEYDRQSDMVDKTKALVLRTVVPAKAELLGDKLSLREWMVILEATTAPTYRQRIEIERSNYNGVLESFDLESSEADWAHEWYSAVTRCHRLNFPETHCGTWLRDVADCVLPFSPNLFDKFMLGADRLDLAAIEWRTEAERAVDFQRTHRCSSRNNNQNNNNTHTHNHNHNPNHNNNNNNSSSSSSNHRQGKPQGDDDNDATCAPVHVGSSHAKEAVELAAAAPGEGDRIWTFLEVYREIRDIDFSGSEADAAIDDAASWKDADSPQCPACNLKGHELRHCWYAFEDRRPRGVVLSRSRLRRVEKAIRADKALEQRVEDIYTAFTGGRFYQQQLMLGSTQSAW